MRQHYILPPRLGQTLGAGLVLIGGALCWGHTVDDAYIVARYAQRIAAGLGYTFSAGPATDGVTGPLWLLPGIVASLVGLDAIVSAKLVGLGCMAAAVAHWLAWLGRTSGGARAMPWAALTLGASPTLGAWGVGGLETGLASWLFALAAVAALERPGGPERQARPGRPLRVGACVGALAWLRPELVPAAGLLLFLSGASHAPDARRHRNAALALALLLALGVVAFRLALFGEPLPLSASAKPAVLRLGLGYALAAWAWSSGVLGLGALWALAARGGRRARALLGLLGAHTLALIAAGGDWMPGFRLFAPLVPALVVAMALGVARLLERRRRVLAWTSMAAPLATSLLGLTLQVPDMAAVQRSRDGVGRELQSLLAREYRRVALLDVGYLVYGSDLEVIDLAGVTDPRVGRLEGRHGAKQIAASWLLSQRPDAIVLHSDTEPTWDDRGNLLRLDGFPVERRLAASAELRAEFRAVRAFRYAPTYYYVLLEPRPPVTIARPGASVAK